MPKGIRMHVPLELPKGIHMHAAVEISKGIHKHVAKPDFPYAKLSISSAYTLLIFLS